MQIEWLLFRPQMNTTEEDGSKLLLSVLTVLFNKTYFTQPQILPG